MNICYDFNNYIHKLNLIYKTIYYNIKIVKRLFDSWSIKIRVKIIVNLQKI